MRRALLSFTCFCMAAAVCSGQADTSIEGPSLGYVRTKEGVRGILGIVGASRLGDPVAGDLQTSVVLPGSRIAVGVNGAGELTRINLLDGSTANLQVAGVTKVVSSPAGATFAAIVGNRAYSFARTGAPIGERELPGAPLLTAVADNGSAAAVTIAEPNGEALFLIDEQGSRRLLQAGRFAALAFLPGSGSFIAADDTGAIYRIGAGDLQLTRVAVVEGASALAATDDGSRLLAITDRAIHAIRLDSGASASIDCSCQGMIAAPLGRSAYVLTGVDDGRMWILDASLEQLRLAFVPEAVNE